MLVLNCSQTSSVLGSLLAIYLVKLIFFVKATLYQHHLDVTTSHVVSRLMGHPRILACKVNFRRYVFGHDRVTISTCSFCE